MADHSIDTWVGRDCIGSFRAPGTKNSSSQKSFTWKIVLKWLFIGDTGEDFTLIVQVPIGDRAN